MRRRVYLLLTDLLICPRCGPGAGLVLRADRIEERRVLEGLLGCPDCREQYPIRGGFADLRVAHETPGEPAPQAVPEPGTEEEAFRLAALLGVAAGPGFVLVVGQSARLAPGIAALVERLEVIALDPALAAWTEQHGVSRMAAGAALPLCAGRLRAVALTGDTAAALLDEAARVVAPLGRLVLEKPPADTEARLLAQGLRILARDAHLLVAQRD